MKCRVAFDGRTRLFIDDRPSPPLLYSTGHVFPEQVALAASRGVRLVAFPATCDFHLYRVAEPCWTGPDTFDDSDLDRRILAILRSHPDVLLLPRIYLCSPPWWDVAHPGELVVYDDGTTQKPLLHGAAKDQVPSWCSPVWREAAAANLARFVRRLETGPFAERIAGYMVNSENTEEWFPWGLMEGWLSDYNPAARARFRSWLADRYGSDAALRRAWGRDLAIEEAEIPPGCRRRRSGFSFLDPVADRDIIDHNLFRADLVSGVIGKLARVVKEASNGRALCGTFFGYLLELAYHPDGLQDGGHLGLRRLLADPHVDFLASPSSYARRFLGDGLSLAMVPSASLAAHGRAFFHENDIRTHVLWDDAGFGRTEDAFETASMQLREFGEALSRGHGMWWYDMTGGWYDDPALDPVMRDIAAVASEATGLSRRGVAEIALVLDEESMLHVRATPHQMIELMPRQAAELSRVGAPFDVVLRADLSRTGPYRLLLFPNLFVIGETETRELHVLLDAWGATALFLVAPGLATDPAAEGAASAVTGMTLRLMDAPEALIIRTAARLGGGAFGSHRFVHRVPVVVDPRAEVLGVMAGSGAAALARRDAGRFRTLFSAAPGVPGDVLRHIAADAGVSLWSDRDDGISACSRFVTVHARSTGVRTLRVPGGSGLVDVVSGRALRAVAGAIRLHMTRGETLILRRDD